MVWMHTYAITHEPLANSESEITSSPFRGRAAKVGDSE
jgi:hypothetical protein